jgi:hypothetical protein
MKDAVNAFNNKIRMQAEPVDGLRTVLKIFKDTLDHPQSLQEAEAKKKFFVSEFVPGLVKTLCLQIKLKLTNQEFQQELERLPELVARFAVENLTNEEAMDEIGHFFDYTCKLHKNHCQREGDLKVIAKETKVEIDEEEREYRRTLKVGSLIDCVKLDPDVKVKGWSQAAVVEVLANDMVKVSFEHDSHHSDRVISIYSEEVARHQLKTKEDVEWRNSLQPGDNLDCFDTTGVWYGCTVLEKEVREYQKLRIPMVKLAFRVLHAEGDKEEEGVKFFGWGKEFDEWI